MTADCLRFPGSDRLRNRIRLVSYLTAAGAALWLIPIALLVDDVDRDLVSLVVNAIAAAVLVPVVVGLALRGQRRHAAWRADLERTMLRRHNELVARQTADIQALSSLIISSQKINDAAIREFAARFTALDAKLERGAWEIYADALTDIAGGAEAVNAETTQRIRTGTDAGNVVRMRRASWRN